MLGIKLRCLGIWEWSDEAISARLQFLGAHALRELLHDRHFSDAESDSSLPDRVDVGSIDDNHPVRRPNLVAAALWAHAYSRREEMNEVFGGHLMFMRRWPCLIGLMTIFPAVAAKLSEPTVFTGTCDASASVSISRDLFVVANDEDNVLRFYRFSKPGAPVQSFDLKPLFTNKKKSPEADLEGAARMGDTVYFISSHGQNSKGQPAPERHRFFAVKFAEANGQVGVQREGRVYTNLVADIAQDPNYREFDLAGAAGRAPKTAGSFNVESLAATPDGHLLIGFRSPTFKGRALLAPMLNPAEVIAGQAPRFAAPIQLDFGGLGFRDMTAATNGYYILAGSVGQGGVSRLYFWSGGAAKPELRGDVRFDHINPEAINFMEFESGGAFMILSDDGNRKINGVECKSLPEAQRQFRAYRFVP